jgi:sugar phosphate isomerase/epimerase
MMSTRCPASGISRREFLSSVTKAAAAVGALPFIRIGRCSEVTPAVPKEARLRFGFTTYQWGHDWDIATLIKNLSVAKIYGVELRTSSNYSHGVELSLSAAQRGEVKKQFADSPITMVGIASGERLDWPEPGQLREAIENSKGYLKLSQEVGGSGVRVFPNQFHTNVPREKTIAQIAGALNEIGAFAAQCGQEVRFESHGAAGELGTIYEIMQGVEQPSVRVKLNSDARDTAEFRKWFSLLKDRLGHTLHLHNLKETDFPYQLQTDLLWQIGWDGWALLEVSHEVPDRVQALIEQREIWDAMVVKAAQAKVP